MKKQEKIDLIKNYFDNNLELIVDEYAYYVGSYENDVPVDSERAYEQMLGRLGQLQLFNKHGGNIEEIDGLRKNLKKLDKYLTENGYDYFIYRDGYHKIKGFYTDDAAEHCLNLPYNSDFLDYVIETYNII